MRYSHRFSRVLSSWTMAALALVLWSVDAYCGPVPPPMEVDLDLAKHVVVGRITEFDKEFDPQGGLQEATATIAVKEILKGPKQTFVKAEAVIGIGKAGWGGAWIPHIRKKGDSGVWILGNASEAFGLVPESKLEQVKQAMDFLSKRKWTNAEGGLVAWAGVLYPQYEYEPSPHPWIVLAIRNVSDHDIYYPIYGARGTAIGKTGTVLRTTPKQSGGERVFCRKILPRETVYVVNYFFTFHFGEVPPDTYKVSFTYENSQDGETAIDPATYVPVKAWKGTLTPLSFEVPTGEPKKKGNVQQPPERDK